MLSRRNCTNTLQSIRGPRNKLLQALLHHNLAAVHNTARSRQHTLRTCTRPPLAYPRASSSSRVSHAHYQQLHLTECTPVAVGDALSFPGGVGSGGAAAGENVRDVGDSDSGVIFTPQAIMHGSRRDVCNTLHGGQMFAHHQRFGARGARSREPRRSAADSDSLIAELKIQLTDTLLSDMLQAHPPRHTFQCLGPVLGTPPSTPRHVYAHAKAGSLHMHDVDSSPTPHASSPPASTSATPHTKNLGAFVRGHKAKTTHCGLTRAALARAQASAEACRQFLATSAEPHTCVPATCAHSTNSTTSGIPDPARGNAVAQPGAPRAWCAQRQPGRRRDTPF